MESDGILQSTANSLLLALASSLKCVTYMSWNRIFERSKAFEASERSIAASIVVQWWGRSEKASGVKRRVHLEL
jgi:hypothetical protein